MAKIKFDVSQSDPDEAKEVVSGLADSPKPGLHRFRIKEVDAGFSKGEDGKPDKNKPRIEVVFECQSAAHRGAHVWVYYLQEGHEKYQKRDAQKWDQLLLALGIASKTKRAGTIDTDKQMVGKFIVGNVKAGKSQTGEYRGEIAQVFPDGHEGAEPSAEDDDELIDESEEVVDDEDVMDDEGVDWDARTSELSQMSGDELKAIAKEWKDAGWDITIGGTKAALVDKIVAVEQAASEQTEEDEEVVSDDDEVLDDDEVIEEEEDTTIYLTREQLMAMESKDLIAAAKDFDIVTKGKKKSEVIAEILTAQAAPGDEDEMPF